LLPEFGALKVNQITSLMIKNFIRAKADQASPRTGELSRRTLRALLNAMSLIMKHAVNEGLGIVRNPLKDDPVIVAWGDDEEAEIPELDEIMPLLRAIIAPRQPHEPEDAHRARMLAVALAVFGGLRRGEICALKWQHVHLDGWRIDVLQSFSKYDGIKLPKTRSGKRSVAMNAIVHRMLEEHAERYGWPTDGWVLRNKNGNRLHPDNVTGYHWPKICREAGLVHEDGTPLYTFHQMRHLAGSLWLAEGMSLEDVSRILGHSNISTTWRIYAQDGARPTRRGNHAQGRQAL
jgi:integrase